MFPDITCDDIFHVETPRLWLRWLRASDAHAVGAFAALAPVAQMTASIPHPYPAGEAERFILHARGATASGRALILAATLKNKARTLIGLVSAQADEAREIELGYVVAPTYAGRGYASEATASLIDVVFNLTEARAVIANTRTINPASRRVLEKCGFDFTHSGLKDLPARGGKHTCDFFVLDRHRWSADRVPPRRLPSLSHQPASVAGLDAQQQAEQPSQ